MQDTDSLGSITAFGPMRAQCALLLEKALNTVNTDTYPGDASVDATFAVCKAWHGLISPTLEQRGIIDEAGEVVSNHTLDMSVMMIAAAYNGVRFIGGKRFIFSKLLTNLLQQYQPKDESSSVNRSILATVVVGFSEYVDKTSGADGATSPNKLTGTFATGSSAVAATS